MCRGLPAIAVFIAALCTLSVNALEEEASACAAIAAELQRRLDSEKPRNSLDLRHRLDSEGQRYGKVIEFRSSELRSYELLDDLCETMKSYMLVHEEGRGKRRWAKLSGDGAEFVAAELLPTTVDEKEHRRRQLVTYCGRVMEDHEDDLVQGLRSDKFNGGALAPLCCGDLVKACPASEPAAAQDGAARANEASPDAEEL